MITYASILIGFVLDLLLGEPEWMPHPARLLRRLAGAMNRRLPGTCMAILLLLLTLIVAFDLLWLCYEVTPWLYCAVQAILCWQCFAMKNLVAEDSTVEQFSDGAVAPLLCMLVGGAPLALTYLAIYTTRHGYGRGAEKLYSGASWLPKRLATPLWKLGARGGAWTLLVVVLILRFVVCYYMDWMMI